MNKRRALLSVSDKKGLEEFARRLSNLGFELLASGGTLRVLNDAGLEATAVSEVTGFPEILGGRVKTLHPLIHGAILARLDNEAHLKELARFQIAPIELVAVNFYPFEETVSKEGVLPAEAIENIDIGGPAMLRAAAKNHEFVTVVVSPAGYAKVIEELETGGRTTLNLRRALAAEAFAYAAAYDAMVAAYLKALKDYGAEKFPRPFTVPMVRAFNLRYGENPQQSAAFYRSPGSPQGLAAAKKLQGKELSFNNLNDLNAAWDLVLEFDKPTAVAVKHTNPCGVGSAGSLSAAYRLAFEADPLSIFGGVVALNRPVDFETATELVKIFLEVIAAPAFSPEALEVLAAKKEIRLLEMPQMHFPENDYDLKKINGGFLLQSVDREKVDVSRGQVVTKRAPTLKEWRDLNFAQTVVKHVRSNAIVVAKNEQTLGVGAGQTSRIGAATIAINQAGTKARGAVLGSDAFFPFADTVEEAARAGITAIVQPGGSLKDEDSIKLCDTFNIAMVLTGRRYFKH